MGSEPGNRRAAAMASSSEKPSLPTWGRVGLAGCLTVVGGVLLFWVGTSVYYMVAWRSLHERVRCTACQENLRRIGVALHRYHDTYGCFPPAAVTDTDGRPMHSWAVLLLPFVDEHALYQAYNFRHPSNAAANATVGRTRLSQFLCPSAPHRDDGVTDYRMVVCPGSICGVNRCAKINDITDGTSHTILVVEASCTPCAWASPQAVVDLRRGINLPDGVPAGANSEHPGGVFVLFADGQVRFLRDDLDTTTLRKLCTMAGNEVIDDDAW